MGVGGTVVLIVLSLIFHRDFLSFFSGAESGPAAPAAGAVNSSPAEDREVQFVSFVLDDAQKQWESKLPQETGTAYRHARLVLFRDLTDSGCGTAQSATGPFYCPTDEKVYLDLGFFDELRRRFGAPGEFAQAYVIAHELGHHVQKLLGIQHASVGLELQADCLAGVWANSTRQRDLIDSSDVDAGLRAAAAVGDDRLQRMSGRHVTPETFTHGSSEQRVNAFRRGLGSGALAACVSQ